MNDAPEGDQQRTGGPQPAQDIYPSRGKVPGWERAWLQDIYYDELNSNAEFQNGVRACFDALDIFLPRLEEAGKRIGKPPMTATHVLGIIWPQVRRERDHVRQMPRKARSLAVPRLEYKRLCCAVRYFIVRFCRRWPLPQDVAQQVLSSHSLRPVLGDRLMACMPQWNLAPGDMGQLPGPGLEVVTQQYDVLEGTTLRVVERQPWIEPPLPIRFRYDPRKQDRKWLNGYMGTLFHGIRESILAMAEIYEQQVKEARYIPHPTPYRTETESNIERLRLQARMVYFRAGSEKLTYGQIAIRFSKSKAAVIEQTQAFANLIGVRLPP